MFKIVGIGKTSFLPKDSDTPIEGLNFHVVEPFPEGKGEGVSTDHFFLSKAKVSSLDFQPALGQEVEILYNRYGKVGALRLLTDNDGEIDID